MIALGTGPLSQAAFRVAGAGTPAPAPVAPTFNTIVIEGDSITSALPSTYAASFYSYQYDDHLPDRTVEVRAQSSRGVGTSANLDDNGNTLFGNVAEDAAYAPDLLTMMIGANDFTLGTDTAYRANLIDLRAAYASARAALKVAWSPPLPYNPTGTPHANKGNFDTQRASLLADCRNPAVWGQWADFYLPMGEHPDFSNPSTAAALFGDTVHPNAAGQSLLFAVYKAAIDSLLDPARQNSASMFNAAWLGNETNLAPGSTITRRLIVSGLKWTGHDGGVSVTGGGSPSVKVGGHTPSGRVYNGDVVDLTLTVSAAFETDTGVNLTIGGETRRLTYRSAANVQPVAYEHGGFDSLPAGGAGSRSFGSKAFASSGLALVCVTQSDAAAVTSLTIGGVAATQLDVKGTFTKLSVWALPIAAGNHAIAMTQTGFQQLGMTWGVLTGADAMPTAISSAAPGAEPNPHATSSLTVPANGIMLGFIEQTDGSPGCVTGPGSTQVSSDLGPVSNGLSIGIILGKRTTTGSIGFDLNSGGGYGNFPRIGLVFKASGT